MPTVSSRSAGSALRLVLPLICGVARAQPSVNTPQGLGGMVPSGAEDGPMRLLLIAPSWPWVFGPYQNQQAQLGEGLTAIGHEVFWNAAFRPGLEPYRLYTALEASAASATAGGEARVVDEAIERASKFTYITVPLPAAYQNRGRGVLVSAVNAAARFHKIDAVICLMDVSLVLVDEPFVPYSLMWFPSHFHRLSPNHHRVLAGFNTVVTMAPSVAEMIREGTREGRYTLSEVALVPHAVEPPRSLDLSALALSAPALRRQYEVPEQAFMVLVNCGNYEDSGRKAIDVAVMAFEELLRTVPDAFLFLKATSSEEIMLADGQKELVNEPKPGIELAALIEAVGLPEGSYRVEERAARAPTRCNPSA